MVRRGEGRDVGGLWLQSCGLSVRSEVMGRFYRVRRAASSLQLQPEEPLAASHHAATTATLTMLRYAGDDGCTGSSKKGMRCGLHCLDGQTQRKRQLGRPLAEEPSLPAVV